MNVDKKTTVSVDSSDDPAGKIERWIADGKAKQAVELAKEQHKKFKTPQTEDRLVRAYRARIEQFFSKGMNEEAQALLALVTERFPAERDRLGGLRWRGTIAAGRIREVAAALGDPHTPAEERQTLDELIRRELIDPSVLAAALPAGNPLRESALAIASALEAATSRPVTDEEIALPMLSHRSPLAPWKLLIRAIAAFYRREDDACRRALDAIPADLAVAPLAAAMRGMLDRTPSKGGAAGALQVRVTSDIRPLAEALDSIDHWGRRVDETRFQRAIREAIRQCTVIRPEFVDRLKQHVSIKCYFDNVPLDIVQNALGRSRKDAFFWRQLALAAQLTEMPIEAAAYWERFCAHSISEKAFAATSHEAATIWQHLAEILSRMSPHRIEAMRDQFAEYQIMTEYYAEQPAEIAALRPKSDQEYARRVLDPASAFAEAARLAPAQRTFQQWFAWGQKYRMPRKQLEDIALRWSQSLPADVEPMIILADFAEQRDALAMALKRVAAAEAIDPANPQVRRARIRLTLATAWRHFALDKLHLVEADVAELAQLPGLRDTESEAAVSFMRAALRLKLNDPAGAAEPIAAGMRRAGRLAGEALLTTVFEKAGLAGIDRTLLPPKPDQSSPTDVARAEAAVFRLSLALEMPIGRPADWDAKIDPVLREPNCPLSLAELLAIGNSAAGRSNFAMAYLASSAGLAQSRLPADSARFLFLRAQSLTPDWAYYRAEQCLRGALELAKTSHDEKLLQQVLDELDRRSEDGGFFDDRSSRAAAVPLNAEEILGHERQAPVPPSNRDEAVAHLIPTLVEQARYDDTYDFDEDEDDDDEQDEDEDEDDDQPGLFDEGEDEDDEEFDPADFSDPAGPLPTLLQQLMESRGLSLEDVLTDPRKLLDLFADPTLGLSPDLLNSMRAKLQSMDPQGKPASPAPKPGRHNRKKRPRK